jgi:hypothetical protein
MGDNATFMPRDSGKWAPRTISNTPLAGVGIPGDYGVIGSGLDLFSRLHYKYSTPDAAFLNPWIAMD